MTSGSTSSQPDPAPPGRETAPPRSPSMKAFAVGALLISLILAGVVSFYASGNPDGLTRVAADKGLDEREKSSATADSPLADYAVKDIDNPRLSGGLAGVLGVSIVLVLAGGVAYAVRRRTPEADKAAPSDNAAGRTRL